MPESQRRPRVAFIGTGGTIASVGHDSLDMIRYAERGEMLTTEALLARVPEVDQVAEIVIVPFPALISPAVGPQEWRRLHRAIHEAARASPAPDGIVVTHGTATLEETAYFLNLTLKVEIPVVVTGAQRPASGLGTDAGPNIVAAARVAGEAASCGRGVLVVFNDEIHAAREATKSSTLKLNTFRSPDFGALGHADNDRVVYYRRSERRAMPETEFDGEAELPRVDIVYSHAGGDGALIDAAVAAGARGLVLAAFAPGYVTPAQFEAVARARAEGVVIVEGSRAGSGRVPAMATLRVDDCVTADTLSPQKARILLLLALTVSDDPARIQAMFDRY